MAIAVTPNSSAPRSTCQPSFMVAVPPEAVRMDMKLSNRVAGVLSSLRRQRGAAAAPGGGQASPLTGPRASLWTFRTAVRLRPNHLRRARDEHLDRHCLPGCGDCRG